MTNKSHIGIRNLNVYYGTLHTLKNISIDIPDKKITAIIGPSGCGKTTLLKSLNRLLELQENVRVVGEVLVDGENIYGAKVEITHLRKRMGLLSQRPQVLPMSIYDNVVYGLRIHGEKDKARLDQAVERYLKQANLWSEVRNRLHASASRLSIGQQQRLCLARGLAVEPEIILGDEPTSALDPLSAEQIEQRFLALKNQYTIVLVTHILRQAKRLADYVIFLYLGDLIEHGPAEKFFNNPKYAKTKAYLEGRFIEEFAVYKEIDLRETAMTSVIPEVRTALSQIQGQQILRVIVDQEEKASRILAAEGHSVLEVKRINSLDWEIIIQKQTVTYAI